MKPDCTVQVRDLFTCLDRFAPVGTKMDFDNVGHLVGHERAEVSRVLVALDITDEVIDEAIAIGAQLIVAHHPLSFGLKAVTDGTLEGKRILKLAEHRIAAISMHTNLDAAMGGVNDALAEALGLEDVTFLQLEGETEDGREYGHGRMGSLNPAMDMDSFLAHTKTQLNTGGIRYYDSGRPVQRVAVLGGSGGDFLEQAIGQGCDTFVTADVKYHVFLNAKEYGVNLLDADHFCTENVVCPKVQDLLAGAFPQVETVVSAVHRQTVKFF